MSSSASSSESAGARVAVRAQAGCAPVKVTKKKGLFKVLLLTNRGGDGGKGKKWILPKGSVKKRETNEEAAVRETWEEAAVKGRVLASLGSVYFRKKNASVEYFVLRVAGGRKAQRKARKKSKEKAFREVKWCTLDEARELVTQEHVRVVLDRLEEWADTNKASVVRGKKKEKGKEKKKQTRGSSSAQESASESSSSSSAGSASASSSSAS